MRVYEFSKQVGVTNKEIIQMLKDGGFEIQNHMSVLNEDALSFLQKKLKNISDSPKNEPMQSIVETKKSTPVKIEPQKIEKSSERVDLKAEKIEPKASLPAKNIKPEIKPAVEQNVVISLKPMMLGELADRLNKQSTELILSLLKRGLVYNKNQVLPQDIVEQLAIQFGAQVEKEAAKAVSAVDANVKIGKNLKHRLPVVVVIGHVDHGKTTLLDFIRKTRVASREKGGITQHLGAYEVITPKGGIVFLDTPGHEAFSMIRTRGVRVADIAILVVAADDGVMPQTVEAIKIAQSKNIPIIVAINKADKVDAARIDQVKQQLSKHSLLSEDWGGQTIVVPISAKLGQGIDQLLEMILLQAEMLELSADESLDACGYVLESKFEKGLGAVATFVAQHGVIKIGDLFVCGSTFGKVTVLVDSYGKRVNQAGPSIPVQISGFNDLPQVGDYLQVVDASEYKKIKANRSESKISQPSKAIPQDAINVILKTDNDSSKEALINSISQLAKKDEKEVYIVLSGVGGINESDVDLAASVGAIIYGFGVKTETNVSSIAQKNGVSIRLFDIIYRLIDDMKELIKSKKETKYKQVKTGEAVVRKIFNIKSVGVISGFYVKDGKIVKNGIISVFRGNKKVGGGEIKTLQRDKKVMKEIAAGFEGALIIDGFGDWAIDDRIECFINVPIE